MAGPCNPIDWREDRRMRPEWVLEPWSGRKGLADCWGRGSASSCFRGIRELMPVTDSAPLPGRVGTWGPMTQWTHPPLYVHTRGLQGGMTLLLHSLRVISLGHSISISEYTSRLHGNKFQRRTRPKEDSVSKNKNRTWCSLFIIPRFGR